MYPVLGVVGGSGGVGASRFAAVLAAVAGDALLVDADVAGGGLDVLLGIESVPGARWSAMRLAGGYLDPATLLTGLPRWGPVAVLAADVAALDPAGLEQVVTAGARAVPVVLDLPRTPCPERAVAVRRCDLTVVLARADVSGVVAAHATATALADVPVGLVVRRGELPASEVAELVGRRLLGVLPGGLGDVAPARLPRAAARVAAGIWSGLQLDVADGARMRPAGRHALVGR